MKKIKLTQNKVALVDKEDYEIVNSFNWTAHKGKLKHSYYAIRMETHPITKKKQVIRMHSFILGLHNIIDNSELKKEIDHKNRNSLDNRKSNLRFLTASENKMNTATCTKIYKTSKYKGVSKVGKVLIKYSTQITIRKVNVNLGRYNTEKEAAKVYDAVARYYFPDIAYTNFEEVFITPMSIGEAKEYYKQYKLKQN